MILLFGFLIFGPDKLPAIAKTLGRAIAKFRDAQEEMSGQLKKQSFVDKDSDEPFKNPLDVIEKAATDAKSGVANARKKADEVSDAVSAGVDAAVGGKAAQNKTSDSQASNMHEGQSSEAQRSASFAERKARYDKERAERKAKERAEIERAQAEAADKAEKEREAKENPLADVPEKKVVEVSDDASSVVLDDAHKDSCDPSDAKADADSKAGDK